MHAFRLTINGYLPTSVVADPYALEPRRLRDPARPRGLLGVWARELREFRTELVWQVELRVVLYKGLG